MFQGYLKKLKSRGLQFFLFILCLLFVPVNLAMNNWDDHDRSGRYKLRNGQLS